MRIISGKYKGRVIPQNPKLKARPTTDKAKESLFNILNFEVDYPSLKVLDLFSGTGNISFEFASRGVTDITAVELRFEHIKFIHKVNQLLGTNVKIIKGNVFNYIKNNPEQYDIVFADPPFDLENFKEVYALVKSSHIVKTDGLFILEHGPYNDFSKELEFYQVRKYGKVNFSFFKF